MTDNYETQRTIEEVFDLETGEIIDSKVFFKKPESEIIAYRRILQEAINGYGKPKLVCLYCNQLLKLSGLSTRRGMVSFFAHLHDSDDCEIKTDGNNLSKEQIEILKYSKIRESERHKYLKNRIYNCLTDESSTLNGVKDVAIEKRIVSKLPYYNWRQPDISFEYGGKKIVLELQLSTTFLSVVIKRDIFYKMNEMFIIWVFNFSENQQYVNLGNLMCKDIYYANKRNVFIFDNEAMELSELKKELILRCVWYEPKITNGIFDPIKSIRKEEFVSLSDLKFDTANYKPFYVNADLLFDKYQPSLKIQRQEEEIRIQNNLNKQIKLRDINLTPFNDSFYFYNGIKIENKNYSGKENFDKWGFKNEIGTKVIPAQYSEVFNFRNGISWVRKKNWGAIDSLGHKVVNFQFREIRQSIFNEYIIATDKQGKIGILSNDGFIIVPYGFDEVKDFIDGKFKVRKNNRWGVIDDKGRPITENRVEIEDNIFKGTQFGFFGLEDENGKVFLPFEYYIFEEIIDSKAIVMKDRKYGVINMKGETVIPLEYDLLGKFIENKLIAKQNSLYGVINLDRKTVIPFEYYSIEKIVNGYAISSKKFSEWGIQRFGTINQEGEVVISFEYDSINDFTSDKYRAKKNQKYGVITLKGETVVPYEYDSISELNDGIAKAYKNNILGYIDENGNTVITEKTVVKANILKGQKFGKWGIETTDGKIILPFEYDFITDYLDGRAKVKKGNKWGCIDSNGEFIIPIDYDSILEFENGIATAQKNSKWGVINPQGETIIQFEYTTIQKFVNGLAKAQKNNKWGIINQKSEIVIPFKYDLIGEFVGGKAKANRGWTSGYIDEKGNELISDITKINEGVFKGQKFGKWGIESHDGKIILPFEYDSIKEFIDGKAEAYKIGGWGYIDEKGNQLIKDKIEIKEGIFMGHKFGKYGLEDKNGEELIPFKYDFIAPYKNGKALCYMNGKFKVENNSAFKTHSYRTQIDGISSFGVFLKIPYLSERNIVFNKTIEVKGLLHISEINKAKKQIGDFVKGDNIDLYILYADEQKQRISFSFNPAEQNKVMNKNI